ncbi:MAG: carboxypeptidase regulatory-like domain-containing protein [Planctomycetaceae bacterium]|nr:carboxypeptidase regulatory-like domain-containing protein [Planctomycetaceae bacterium]
MNYRVAQSLRAIICWPISKRIRSQPQQIAAETLEFKQLLSSQTLSEQPLTEPGTETETPQTHMVYDYPSVSSEIGEVFFQEGAGAAASPTAVGIEASGRIVARIRDSANDPVEGAVVTLRGNGNYRTLITDSRGIVVMTQLQAGTYEVSAEKSGLGVSLVKLVVLNTDRATEYPIIKVPGVRFLINNVETQPNPVQLLDTVRFRYFLNGDDALATDVRIEGRLVGREYWETVITEDPANIQNGNTLTFQPRMVGDFEFRVRVEHGGRVYTSKTITQTVDYRTFTNIDITRDRSIVSTMKLLWNRTKSYAYAKRATGERREFAFSIYYDTATGRFTRGIIGASDPVSGDDQPYTPKERFVFPDTSIWSTSPNGTMTYLVGVFHTHTPMTYAPPNRSRVVGPSTQANNGSDLITITDLAQERKRTILGFVYDYHGKRTLFRNDKRVVSGHNLNDSAKIWSFQGNP